MFDSLFGNGSVNNRETKRNIRTLERDLKKALRGGDESRAAEIHEKIAFAKLQCADYRGAIESWYKVIQIHNQTGDRGSAARAYSNIGAAYREMGDLQNAEENVKKARLIDEQIGDGRGLMLDLMNRGILEMERGEALQAASSFGESYEQAQALREPIWSSWLLRLIGEAELRAFRFHEAVEALEAFLESIDATGDPYPAVEGARLLAQTYLLAGMYFSCHQCLEDAAECAQRSGVSALQGAVLAEQGHLHIVVGDIRKGRELTEMARGFMDDSSPQLYRLLVDRNMGRILMLQGRALNGARKHLSAGLTRAQGIRSWRLEGAFHLQLAEVEFLGGKFPEAENAVHQAVRMAELTRDEALLIGARILMARLAQKQGQAAQSHELRVMAVEQAAGLPIPELRWRAHYSLARSLISLEEFQEALEHFLEADRIMESARKFLSMDYMAKAYFEARERADVHRDLVRLLIRMGHKEDAHSVFQKIANRDVQASLAPLFAD